MFVPFVAGHLLQPWIGSWVQQRRKVLGGVDRGSVLLVVYTVFSGATLSRLWHQLAFEPLIALFGVAGTRLGLMLAITALAARRLSFSREDEIAIVFCGSKKSFVAGIPKGTLSMANDELGWVFTSYIAASVITMPMTRWLAGRYGRKLVYQLSITGFALGLVLDTRAATRSSLSSPGSSKVLRAARLRRYRWRRGPSRIRLSTSSALQPSRSA